MKWIMPAQENRWNEEETSNVCSLDRRPHVAASSVRQAGMGCPSLISHGERGCRGCCREQLADSLWEFMLCPLPLFYPGTPPPSNDWALGAGRAWPFLPHAGPFLGHPCSQAPCWRMVQTFSDLQLRQRLSLSFLPLLTSVPSSVLPLTHVSPAALQSEGFPCCLASFLFHSTKLLDSISASLPREPKWHRESENV